MAQIIPITDAPNQTLNVTLSVDGNVLRLQLEVYFSEMAGYWLMDISDAFGTLILASLPLITGSWPAANILAQYYYLKIGSAFVINLGQTPDDYPGATDWATGFALLWDDSAK
jgi:hypothetical protein